MQRRVNSSSSIFNRIAVATKKGLPSFGPMLPSPPLLMGSALGRDFLFAKCTYRSKRKSLYTNLPFFFVTSSTSCSDKWRVECLSGTFLRWEVQAAPHMDDSGYPSTVLEKGRHPPECHQPGRDCTAKEGRHQNLSEYHRHFRKRRGSFSRYLLLLFLLPSSYLLLSFSLPSISFYLLLSFYLLSTWSSPTQIERDAKAARRRSRTLTSVTNFTSSLLTSKKKAEK